MKRVAFFAYGMSCYVLFLATLLYLMGFVANIVVPKSIDSGAEAQVWQAVFINTLLIALFGIQHSVMARPGFKNWWTRIVPPPVERSTFVLMTCLLLGLLFWQWRPIASVVWQVNDSSTRLILGGLCVTGWGLVLYSSFLIDHFDLFGIRQVFLYLRGREYSLPTFKLPVLYKLVRNPLMLGLLIAFWSTPDMTYGHLLFSVVVTAYIFVGVSLEERDLANLLGERYRRYREGTAMLIPLAKRKRRQPVVAGADSQSSQPAS